MTRENWSSRKGRSSKWISKTRRLAIYIRDEFACAYCGTDLREVTPSEIALDHLRPRVNGGSHDPKNLITACRKCNSGRQDRPWTSYATPGARARIERLRRRTLNLELAAGLLSDGTTWADLDRAEISKALNKTVATV